MSAQTGAARQQRPGHRSTNRDRRDGAGYRLLADKVLELDRSNPQLAARLLAVLGRWRRFDELRQSLMLAELERVVAAPNLSRDTFEIASKSLK